MTKSPQDWSTVRDEMAEKYRGHDYNSTGACSQRGFEKGFDAALKLAQEEIAQQCAFGMEFAKLSVNQMLEITTLRAQVAEMKEALEWCADNENSPGECFNRACEVLAKLEGK